MSHYPSNTWLLGWLLGLPHSYGLKNIVISQCYFYLFGPNFGPFSCRVKTTEMATSKMGYPQIIGLQKRPITGMINNGSLNFGRFSHISQDFSIFSVFSIFSQDFSIFSDFSILSQCFFHIFLGFFDIFPGFFHTPRSRLRQPQGLLPTSHGLRYGEVPSWRGERWVN